MILSLIFQTEYYGVTRIWKNEIYDPRIDLGVWSLSSFKSPSAMVTG